jgi:hypothetical protein
LSEQNVELVRALYEPTRESGWETVIANRRWFAPEVEVDFSAIYPDATPQLGSGKATTITAGRSPP